MRKNLKREKWISRISLVTIALACQNAVYADDVPSSSTIASSIVQQESRTVSGTIPMSKETVFLVQTFL